MSKSSQSPQEPIESLEARIVGEPDVNARLQAVRRWLQGLEEPTRRRLLPGLKDLLERLQPQDRGQHQAGVLALFGCGQLADIKTQFPWSWPDPAMVAQVLAERQCRWVDGLARHCLENNHYWSYWPWLRALVRAQLIEPPTHPNYVLGMIGGATYWKGPGPLLQEDPGAQELFWQLFVYEGGGENSLANYDRFQRHGTWSEIALKTMDRTRLFRECLGALARDFNHYRARWFSDLHRELRPTTSEKLEQAGIYLQLLHSSSPATVQLAQEVVDELTALEPCPFSPAQVVGAQLPLLRSKSATSVKKALTRLEKLAQNVQVRQLALQQAVEGLLHPKADVQAAVLRLLSKWSPELTSSDRQRLQEFMPIVAASQLRSLEDLCGVTPPQGPPLPMLPDWPCEEFGPAAQLIVGPSTLVELVQLCAKCLEDSEPIGWELALDGLCRLGQERPEDWSRLVSPLKKRAGTLHKKLIPGPRQALVCVILTWCEGRLVEAPESSPGRKQKMADLVDWLGARCNHISRLLLSGVARPLLSCPTSSDGRIEPDVAAQRRQLYQEQGWVADPCDLLLWEARSQASNWEVELSWMVEVSHYVAYGKPGVHRFFRTDEFQAAAPWSPLHLKWSGESEELYRLLSILWPHQLDLTFAPACHLIANNLLFCEARWHDRWLVEPLHYARRTPTAWLLLALALGSREPGLQNVAVDVLVGAVLDDPLLPSRLSHPMGQLAANQLVPLSRWAKSFEKASATVAARQGLHELLWTLLREHSLETLKDSHQLVELLLELRVQCGLGPLELASSGKGKYSLAVRKLRSL